MRRATLENLARCLDPGQERSDLDRIATARRILYGLCDPDDQFARQMADQIIAIVSDIDDGNGGRDLHIDKDDARRAWITLMNHEMCRARVRHALATDFKDVSHDLDEAVQIAVDMLSMPSDSLIDGFCSSAAQVVETWDYRSLDQITVSVARCCEEWNDLLVCLAR